MIGCDIVAISRLERIYNRYGVNFLDKFLSKDEQGLVFSGLRGASCDKNGGGASCDGLNHSGASLGCVNGEANSGLNFGDKNRGVNLNANLSVNLDENSGTSLNKPNFATIAGFFAVKEAASKALGCGICKECGFLDIRIYKDAKNAPKLEFSSKIKAHFKLKEAFVSIAHDGGFAMAVVALKFA